MPIRNFLSFCLMIFIQNTLLLFLLGWSLLSSGQLLATSKQGLNLTHHKRMEWVLGGVNTYNPNSSVGFGERIDDVNGSFAILHQANTHSEFLMTFSTLGLNDSRRYLKKGKSVLYYQIYKSSEQNVYLSSQVSTDQANLLTGEIEESDSAVRLPLSYYFYIIPGQFVRAGIYKDQVTIRLYEARANGTYSLVDTERVKYRVYYPSRVRVSIDGKIRENYIFDFGELRSFEKRDLELKVEANTGYSLKIKSENGGFLKNQDLIGGVGHSTDSQLPYQLTFDGTLIPLSQAYQQVLAVEPDGSGNTVIKGEYPLSIILSEVDEKIAGYYLDTIYLTIQNAH